MNEPAIRITHRGAQDCNPAEIVIEIGGAVITAEPSFLSSVETIDDGATVPNYAEDMASAFAKIAGALRCEKNLDDMLHAIDRLAPPDLVFSETLCNGKAVNYAAAVKACDALGDGWRLPTRMELESILDLTRHDPAIDTEKFPDTKSAYYWSSTPCAWSADFAWIVNFGLGSAGSYLRGGDACVRAVRSAPSGQ